MTVAVSSGYSHLEPGLQASLGLLCPNMIFQILVLDRIAPKNLSMISNSLMGRGRDLIFVSWIYTTGLDDGDNLLLIFLHELRDLGPGVDHSCRPAQVAPAQNSPHDTSVPDP